MRIAALIGPVLMSALMSAATPAAAQDRPPVERRVDTLEKQMRSVQRRVFAPGTAPVVDTDATPTPAAANTGAIADLTARVDALERSLTAITGQVEENGNRLRTLEAGFGSRLDRLENAASAPAAATPAYAPPVAQPAPEPAAAPAAAPEPSPASATPLTIDPPSADPAENAYLSGFRLWEAKRYDEAETTLKDMTKRYPKHARASWARNLLGRTYLDTGKPATAAEVFLANYQDLPAGDRAADSLYFLGQALMKLGKPEQACKVYDELGDAYATTMRDYLKQNVPAARKAAKCR